MIDETVEIFMNNPENLTIDNHELTYTESDNVWISIVLIIVLPTIGGLIFLALIIILIVCLYRR